MMMEEAVTIKLDAKDFENAAQVHDYLAEQLEFPRYYGRNLDALNDCLGDICEPTRFETCCKDYHTKWFKKICHSIKHAAKHNDNIEHICWKSAESAAQDEIDTSDRFASDDSMDIE